MSESPWLRALHTTRRSFDEGARSELFLAVLNSPYHSLTRVHVLAYAFAAQQGILEVKQVFRTAPLCSSKCLLGPVSNGLLLAGGDAKGSTVHCGRAAWS